MSDAELRRMREDLDTIQQAAGMGLPFDWADVWETLVLVPAGALLSAWAFFGPEDWVVLGLVPLLLLVATAVVRRVWKKYSADGVAVTARRERTFSTVSTLVIIGGLVVYFVWVRKFGLVHGPPGVVAVFFLGIICLVLGLSRRQRRVAFAGALALIPYALVAPLCSSHQQAIGVGGLAVMVAGLAAAAIMAWQLDASRREHEPATH